LWVTEEKSRSLSGAAGKERIKEGACSFGRGLRVEGSIMKTEGAEWNFGWEVL